MTKQANRVAELSTAIGTGTLGMVGPQIGYQTWSSAFGVGDTEVYYGIIADGSGLWEVGQGTFKGGSHAMQRDAVHNGSSGPNTKVNFTAGDKIIYSTFPAESTLILTPRRPADVGLVVNAAASQTAPQIRVNTAGGASAIELGPGEKSAQVGVAPRHRFSGTTPADPVGRYQWVVDAAGVLRLQRATVAAWGGTADLLNYNPANSTLTLAAATIALTGSIAALTLQNPTFEPVTMVDGGLAATIGIERAWAFAQQSSGAAAALELRSLTSGPKRVRIMNSARDSGIDFSPEEVAIGIIGTGPLRVNASVYANGLAALSNANALFSMLSASGADKGALYSDTTGNVILRNGANSGQIRISATGTITLPAGNFDGINFGGNLAASKNDLSRHIDLYGGIYGLTVTSGSLNLIHPSSAVAFFVGGGTVNARVEPAGPNAPNPETIITREKGDPRYGPMGTDVNYNTVNAALYEANTLGIGFRINNGANEFGYLVGSGTTLILRRRNGATNVTFASIELRADGDILAAVGRWAGDGSGISSLASGTVNAAAAGVPLGGVGDRGTFRMASVNTGITKGNNYAGSAIRWSGANIGSTLNSDVESAGNSAPSGTWQARAQIDARPGQYSTGSFLRVA